MLRHLADYFSWKLNWIVPLCEHRAAASKLSYFPAWSGCSNLIPLWSLFNLQFSFIASSTLASQSGFFSPRLSTHFHSWEQWPQASPGRLSQSSIEKTAVTGRLFKVALRTLHCLPGAYWLVHPGAAWQQWFRRAVFLLRGLAASLIILWMLWNH